jgi:hypothetical protein
MATNISPEMMPLDMGVMTEEPALEIEIEDPESVKIGIDGVEIELMPEPETADTFDANLAEYMDEGELQTLASELIDLVDADINSRKDWTDMFVKGLEVLGMKYEERTEPWNGACGVYSPLLTEAAIRFQSEMITETFPAQGPVKTQIIGAVDRLKEEAAERVRDDMNYMLTERMIDYRSEHERMLYSLGLSGAAFKKIYPNPSTELPAAPFVPAEDLVMPYGASNVYTAERVTHVMRKTENEIKKLQVAGFYKDVELGEPVRFFTDIEKKKAEEQGYTLTDDDRYQVLEIHVDWDMPGYEDEVPLPYGQATTLRPVHVYSWLWRLWSGLYPPYWWLCSRWHFHHPTTCRRWHPVKFARWSEKPGITNQGRRHAYRSGRVQGCGYSFGECA